MKIEITEKGKGHHFNGEECKGGERFDVKDATGKQLIADGIAKDVTPKDAPAAAPKQ